MSAAEQPGDTPASDYDLEKAYAELRDRTCRLSTLHLIGLKRTDKKLVLQELDALKNATTLVALKDALLKAHADLTDLGIFDAVELLLDEGGKGQDTCSVVARFQEKSMFRLHTGTYVQGTEGTVEVGLSLTNPLGKAEQLGLQLEHGSQSTNSFCLSYSRPRFWGRMVGDVRLQQVFHSYERWSSFTERIRGCLATLASEDGRHAFTYECAWQRLADPSLHASKPIIAQLGDHVKSAARYIFRHDTFDDSFSPTTGWGVRSTSELAGLIPDARALRFFKQHFLGQTVLPLSGGLTLTLAAEAGILLPLAATASPVADRFFMGGLAGSGSLRGFSQKGVGPMAPRRPGGAEEAASSSSTLDSLGGDIFCSLLASVRFPLPAEALRAAGVHGHVFLNGGNLVGLGSGIGGGSRLHQFSTTFRWSLGAGIIWPTRVGRLELNVSQILSCQQRDRVKRGLQFGFTPPSW